MERDGPSSFCSSNASSSRLENPRALRRDDLKPTVISWEHGRSYLQILKTAISRSGAEHYPIQNFSVIRKLAVSSLCSIAVVGIEGGLSPGNPDLEVIRTLKEKGFKIVSYGKNARLWPVGLQCQALLAGALKLLDSENEHFGDEMRRLLVNLLKSEAARWDEEQRIKALMGALGVVGESPAMLSVFRWILRLSVLSDVPILITGETGTGKELIARGVCKLDAKRRNGPFVPVNCAAVSPTLAESELFGHRHGAFTGADRDRKGLIRSADGGILFLDEVGDLNDALQTKLLRVIQENRVLGVGEDREVPVSVRFIAATNRDLRMMVEQGKFRADLFHRLNVLSVDVPPLRNRPEDVKPLIEHFLAKYRLLNPAAPRELGSDFIDALKKLELPGNCRQLENVLINALVNKVDDSPFTLSDLPMEIWCQLSEGVKPPLGVAARASERKDDGNLSLSISPDDIASSFSALLESRSWRLSEFLERCEKLLLKAALHAAQGNQSQAARRLGITPRSVYNKIHKHNLQL